VGSAVSRAVRGQGVETKVRVGAGRTVQVAESLLVSIAGNVVARDDSRSGRGHAVERSVGKEGISSVGGNLRTVTIGLRSARVLRVDETAVSAILRSSRAGSGRRGSTRDGIDGGRTGRGRAGNNGRR